MRAHVDVDSTSNAAAKTASVTLLSVEDLPDGVKPKYWKSYFFSVIWFSDWINREGALASLVAQVQNTFCETFYGPFPFYEHFPTFVNQRSDTKYGNGTPGFSPVKSVCTFFYMKSQRLQCKASSLHMVAEQTQLFSNNHWNCGPENVDKR